jgi:holin-like protein
MKYLYQAAVIMAVTLLGELLHLIIPLPIPASIYGLVIMLACLKLRVIKLEHVEDTGGFLLEIMPVLFVPAAAGLITAWAELRAMLAPVVVITVVTTFVVMAATGWAAQLAMKKGKRDGQ